MTSEHIREMALTACRAFARKSGRTGDLSDQEAVRIACVALMSTLRDDHRSTRTIWVDCPICHESDMRCEIDDDAESAYVFCVNTGCPSNSTAGGWIDHNGDQQPVDDDVVVEVETQGRQRKTARAAEVRGWEWDYNNMISHQGGEYWQIVRFRILGRKLSPIEKIETVDYRTGFKQAAPPMWRVTVGKIGVDMPTEEAAINLHKAIENFRRDP